jgi:uncharacterized membrane protein YdjX (TVP38/TMEM64 family)
MNELTKKQKILRTILVCGIIILVLGLLFLVLKLTGAWEKINSAEKIKDFILGLGFWGRFVFVLMQFLQVTFIPIPAAITTIAGALVYGPLEAALLSLAGIFLGSLFAFFLGRVFGRKLVEFMVGKKTCQKWMEILSEGKYAFFVMMLLPIFPDDILCLVAGLTDMSWTFFGVTNLISRPIAIFMTCYLGSGHIIPFHGWGLAVWAVLILITIAVLVLSIVYRNQIENFMKNLFKKKTKNQEKNSQENNKINEVENEKIEKIENAENTINTGE